MSVELVVLGGLAALVGLVIGLLIGRLSAPGDRQCEELREQRDETQRELDRMRQQVDSHFGESARLFANLAHDYRALYEHFADSASQLGLSEGERRDILVSATKPLPSEADATHAATQTASTDSQAGVDFPAAQPEAMATGAFNSERASA